MIGIDYPNNWNEDRKTYDEWWGNEDKLCFDGLELLAENDTLVLMQFTELCDKNGKEIYEEDILSYDSEKRWLSGDGERAVVVWDEKSGRWDLDFYSIYGYEGHLSAEENLGDRINNCKYEIIGNHFENKDLLNE